MKLCTVLWSRTAQILSFLKEAYVFNPISYGYDMLRLVREVGFGNEHYMDWINLWKELHFIFVLQKAFSYHWVILINFILLVCCELVSYQVLIGHGFKFSRSLCC